MGTKTCSVCRCEKDLGVFGRKAASKDGLQEKCKACISAYASSLRVKRAMSQVPKGDKEAALGSFLHAARTAKGLSQLALGELVGVTDAQVRLWEKGVAIPTKRNMVALAHALDVVPPMEVTANNEGRLPVGITTCISCGKSFPQYKARVKHCSKTCSGKTQSASQRGQDNPRWKDGTTKACGGYIKQKAFDGHPLADAGGYVMQHRLVVEAAIGRLLSANERVHHKNGVRDDNRPENLELWMIKGKKDPAGVRVADAVRDLLRSLPPDELAKVLAEFKP